MASSVDQRNPHGDLRRLTPTQRAIGHNTRAGIATIDRLNARNAEIIGDEIRELGDRPLVNADHDNIMASVDRVLDDTFGRSRRTANDSPVGRSILRQCATTGLMVHEAEEKKIADRYIRALRKDPELAREIIRRYVRRSADS